MCMYKSVAEEILLHITWQFVYSSYLFLFSGAYILLTVDFAPLKEKQRITHL